MYLIIHLKRHYIACVNLWEWHNNDTGVWCMICLYFYMCLKNTVPVFLYTLMVTTMIMKTSAAISKMLRTTETIINLPWFLGCCRWVCISSCYSFFFRMHWWKLHIYPALTSIPSIVEYTVDAIVENFNIVLWGKEDTVYKEITKPHYNWNFTLKIWNYFTLSCLMFVLILKV